MRSRWVSGKKERGDTLIEVTLALAILSMTLTGAFSTATKTFQLSQQAKNRSVVAFDAQAQMEAVRSFRDNYAWAIFTNGSTTPVFPGVLGAATSSCHQLSECFHMQASGNTYLPVAGPVESSVSGSYIEIKAIPLPATDPTTVSFEVAWGFPGTGSSPFVKSHFITQLANLNLNSPSVIAATPTPPGPVTPPPPPPGATCPAKSDIVLVLDVSTSMDQLWAGTGTTTRFDEEVRAAKTFIDNAGVGPDKNHVSILVFASDMFRISDFSGDPVALKASIDTIDHFTSGTFYLDPLNESQYGLTNFSRPIADAPRKTIVFISDGEPNDPSVANPGAAAIAKANELKIGTPAIKLYTVGITLDGNNDVLGPMAGPSPGRYIDVDQKSELQSAAHDIAVEAACP